MRETTLKIDGMSCGHCVGSVKKALTEVDGLTVQNVAVGTATVEYDEARVSPAEIAAAVSAAGYPASAA
jgi:copper chaperone